MDRSHLESLLAAGCSLDDIGRRTGRHASTVAYWVEKHGLQAAGHHRHAPRGGLGRDLLADLVERGFTVAEITAQVDRSATTVRYWLRFHGLATTRAARLRAGGAPAAARPVVVVRDCPHHGASEHALRGTRYRCRRCSSEAVSRYRRDVKRRLVAEAGGSCRLCGYSTCMAALEFHHADPSTKRFSLSLKGVARAYDTVREEAAKCVLLCANCHAEVEAGVSILPPVAPGRG
jgi:transposase-like protein/transcription elongation factor Elf1